MSKIIQIISKSNSIYGLDDVGVMWYFSPEEFAEDWGFEDSEHIIQAHWKKVIESPGDEL